MIDKMFFETLHKIYIHLFLYMYKTNFETGETKPHLNSRVVDVFPIPKRGWSVPGHQVVLWHEREEPASA